MKLLMFTLAQAESPFGAVISVLIIFVVLLGVFLILRALVLWYWKVDVIVRNMENQSKQQEYQNKMLEYHGQLLKEQNELLRELGRKGGAPMI